VKTFGGEFVIYGTCSSQGPKEIYCTWSATRPPVLSYNPPPPKRNFRFGVQCMVWRGEICKMSAPNEVSAKAGASGEKPATPNDDYVTTSIIHRDQAGRSEKLQNLGGMEPLPMSHYTTGVPKCITHTHTTSCPTSVNRMWKPCLPALLKENRGM
jgi:hypothetical protein